MKDKKELIMVTKYWLRFCQYFLMTARRFDQYLLTTVSSCSLGLQEASPVLVWYVQSYVPSHDSLIRTSILLRDTQQSDGNSCSMGTRNCRQPSQWHNNSIIPIRLKIRITALARSYVIWKIWRQQGKERSLYVRLYWNMNSVIMAFLTVS